MTDEQVQTWIVERDIARKSGNPELMQQAYDHRDDMMMTCISHQSARVKRLAADVAEIKEDLAPCVESDKDYRLKKAQASGVALFIRILRYVVAAGGGAFIYRIFTSSVG